MLLCTVRALSHTVYISFSPKTLILLYSGYGKTIILSLVDPWVLMCVCVCKIKPTFNNLKRRRVCLYKTKVKYHVCRSHQINTYKLRIFLDSGTTDDEDDVVAAAAKLPAGGGGGGGVSVSIKLVSKV